MVFYLQYLLLKSQVIITVPITSYLNLNLFSILCCPRFYNMTEAENP